MALGIGISSGRTRQKCASDRWRNGGKWVLTSVLGMALLVGLTGRAGAQVYFSNFGAGDTYDTGTGWGINAPQAVAASFTPTLSGNANRIDLALRHVQGTNDYRLQIFSDNNGSPSTNALLTLALTGVAPTSAIPFTVALPAPLTLTAGTRYWVALFNNAPTADGAWHRNTIGQNGFAFTGTPTSPSWIAFNQAAPTFRVYAASSAAPEPETLALFIFGTIAGGMATGRRDRAEEKGLRYASFART